MLLLAHYNSTFKGNQPGASAPPPPAVSSRRNPTWLSTNPTWVSRLLFPPRPSSAGPLAHAQTLKAPLSKAPLSKAPLSKAPLSAAPLSLAAEAKEEAAEVSHVVIIRHGEKV